MAQQFFFDHIDPFLDGELNESVRMRFEQVLQYDEALQNALESRRREKMAMDHLENFLEESSAFESSRKTWLRSLFATVMLMGNFSATTKGMENPVGLRRSDQEEEMPGSN